MFLPEMVTVSAPMYSHIGRYRFSMKAAPPSTNFSCGSSTRFAAVVAGDAITHRQYSTTSATAVTASRHMAVQKYQPPRHCTTNSST